MPLDPQVLKSYALADNIVQIANVTFGGWGENGEISYSALGEAVTSKAGAGGQVTVSKMNDFRLEVTIKLMETSSAIPKLDILRKLQLLTPGRVIGLPYYHIDTITGDEVRELGAVFQTWAELSKEREAGEREYKILLPYAANKQVEGALNGLLGFLP